MSCITVFAPLVVASWPMLAGLAAAAGAKLGYRVATEEDAEAAAKQATEVELEVKNSELVSEGMTRQSELTIVKEDLRVVLRKDARGRLAVCVTGSAERSKGELRQVGQEVVDELMQRYAYQRVVNELKERNFEKVGESVDQQGRIHIRLRRWEE